MKYVGPTQLPHDARAPHGDALHQRSVTGNAFLLLRRFPGWPMAQQSAHGDLGVDEGAGHGAILLHGERIDAAHTRTHGLRDVHGFTGLIVVDSAQRHSMNGVGEDRPTLVLIKSLVLVRFSFFLFAHQSCIHLIKVKTTIVKYCCNNKKKTCPCDSIVGALLERI